jgi:hypothetical protein
LEVLNGMADSSMATGPTQTFCNAVLLAATIVVALLVAAD